MNNDFMLPGLWFSCHFTVDGHVEDGHHTGTYTYSLFRQYLGDLGFETDSVCTRYGRE